MRGRFWIWMGLVWAGCGEGRPATTGDAPGDIIGRVEVSVDVPLDACRVLLEGAPLGARCEPGGTFQVRNVPPGRWDLRVIPEGGGATLPLRRLAVAANPGFVTDIGVVRLSAPGAVGGRVKGLAGADLATAIVAIPGAGSVTAPNENGGYLVTGVPPGLHEVVLLAGSGSTLRANVVVRAGQTTVGVDLDGSTLVSRAVKVSGRARRGGAGDAGHGGVSVDLVETRDGRVTMHTTTATDGSFQLTASPGTYLLRAADGSNPRHAVVPDLVITGVADVLIAGTLVIPDDGDLDGDGTLDAMDADPDGDGFAGAEDAFPFDPAESADRDGDGVGDRSDLRSGGGSNVDQHNPTPDSDADGRFDFEDNCPNAANMDQLDRDGDRIGDACDTCPLVANPDNSAFCVQCAGNAQCAGDVCVGGRCVPCTQSSQCSAGQLCNSATGRCAECVLSPDCGPGRGCRQGQCVTQCSSDSECGSGFCVSALCAQCRRNADCAPGQWCDGGACRALCTRDLDCGSGRVCELATQTCVTPCPPACPTGQVCSSGACRQLCDGARPCLDGLQCSTTTNQCLPQCTMQAQCGAGTTCSGGQCVPDNSNLCATDVDCPISMLCTGGTCLTRPTVFDPGQGYRCNGACQCRTGEVCQLGHCVPDAVTLASGGTRTLIPRRFVAAGASGGGTTAAAPSGDLAAALAAAQAGDTVALLDATSLTGPAAFTVPRSSITLAGGYVDCIGRWVRDPARRSSVTRTFTGAGNDPATPVIALPGSFAAPLADVAMLSLDVTVPSGLGCRQTAIGGTTAPGLTLQNLGFRLGSPACMSIGRSWGVHCDGCAGVRWSDLVMVSAIDGAPYGIARLLNGSGTLTRMRAGGLNVSSLYGVAVELPSGAVTVQGTTLEGPIVTQNGGAGVQVLNAGSQPVVVETSQLVWPVQTLTTASDDWRGIDVSSSDAVTARSNLIDGRSTSGALTRATAAVSWRNSTGRLTETTIYYPLATSTNSAYELIGVDVLGPRSVVDVEDTRASGGGFNATASPGGVTIHQRVQGVTAGAVNIRRADMANAVGAASGLVVQSSNAGSGPVVFVEQSRFQLPTHANCSRPTIGLHVTAGGNARVERSQFLAGDNFASFGALLDGGTAELYQSFLRAGRAAASGCANPTSTGLQVVAGSRVHAVGNTIDAGGAPGAAASTGFLCSNDSTALLHSNLVNAGASGSHLMVNVAGGSGCLTAPSSSYRYNYFWYSGAGGATADSSGAILGAAVGQPDAEGDINGGGQGCYDAATPLEYDLAAASACRDKGMPSPQRKDGTAITSDLDGQQRSRGAAPEAGCFEKE